MPRKADLKPLSPNDSEASAAELPSCQWCKRSDKVKVSSGAGRYVGPIAHSLAGVYAPLPDDFEFLYCVRCQSRVITPEVEKRFHEIEEAWLAGAAERERLRKEEEIRKKAAVQPTMDDCGCCDGEHW